ncbi:MAG: hypothetical protein GX964_07945 [Syntrophomonadaceae bacterium]|nr:hypothetical protein [Syntrophomonadaceae bacterium]
MESSPQRQLNVSKEILSKIERVKYEVAQEIGLDYQKETTEPEDTPE